MSEAPDAANQAPDGLVTDRATPPEGGSEPGAGPNRAPMSSRITGYVEQNWPSLAAGCGVLVVALLLLTRFSAHSALTRDQSIYVYGALRFSHGVPPYVSVFDPKTPGATMLGGIAATFARWFGWGSLGTIRWTFFLVTIATVLVVYALGRKLWSSIVGGVVSAVTLCFLTVFALSGLMGPEAKMPGLFFGALAMYLMVDRRWFWAAVSAGLAFDFWQPFVWYGLIAIIGSVVYAARGRRWRAGLTTFAGAALPTVLLAIYFAANGAFSEFFVAAFEYPLTGTQRAKETLLTHFTHVAKVFAHYPFSNALVWTGVLLLTAFVVAAFVTAKGHRWSVLRSPLVLVVFVTFLLNLAYAFIDFQSDPDTLPLLMYPALGIGGAAAFVVRSAPTPMLRRTAVAAISVLALVGASVSWVAYGNLAEKFPKMRPQLADACGLSILLGKHGELVSLGNPALFVLTHRVSTTRFIYLAAGTDNWKIKHTPGGIAGWAQEITSRHPKVIAIDGWAAPHTHLPNIHVMHQYLHAAGYRRRYLGPWALFMTKDTIAEGEAKGLYLPYGQQPVATRADGTKLPARVPCTKQ